MLNNVPGVVAVRYATSRCDICKCGDCGKISENNCPVYQALKRYTCEACPNPEIVTVCDAYVKWPEE